MTLGVPLELSVPVYTALALAIALPLAIGLALVSGRRLAIKLTLTMIVTRSLKLILISTRPHRKKHGSPRSVLIVRASGSAAGSWMRYATGVTALTREGGRRQQELMTPGSHVVNGSHRLQGLWCAWDAE